MGKKVVIITGPTAVGKTALSLEICKRYNGEVISADSVQVYKNLDVGSDKLPINKREGISHHLLDIKDVLEDFSAAEFKTEGRKAIEEILQRGKTPVVIGGTGLYLQWLMFGDPSPPKEEDNKEMEAYFDALFKKMIGEANFERQRETKNPVKAKRESLVFRNVTGDETSPASKEERNQGEVVNHEGAEDQKSSKKAKRIEKEREDVEADGCYTIITENPHSEGKSRDGFSGSCGEAPSDGSGGASLGAPHGVAARPDNEDAAATDGTEAPPNDKLGSGTAEPTAGGATGDQRTGPNGTSVAQSVEERRAEGIRRSAEKKSDQLRAAAEAAAHCLTRDEEWELCVELLRSQYQDEEAYQRIRLEKNNYYRLRRALTILHQNKGRKLSDFALNTAAAPETLEYDFRCFFLVRPRIELHERVATRVEEMVVGGLVQEAAALLARGITPGQNSAAKAIGYRQSMEWIERLRGENRPAAAKDLEDLVHAVCTATHRLIHQQMTYHRKSTKYTWINVSGRSTDDVMGEVRLHLDSETPVEGGGCKGAMNNGLMTRKEEKLLWVYEPSMGLIRSPAGEAALRRINQEVLCPREAFDEGHDVKRA